jgi:hypothetical protein
MPAETTIVETSMMVDELAVHTPKKPTLYHFLSTSVSWAQENCLVAIHSGKKKISSITRMSVIG